MTDEQKIISKINKILQLAANAGTPEEAANAAARAQALMNQYNLTQARVEAEAGTLRPAAPIVRRCVDTVEKRHTWIVYLMNGLCANGRCRWHWISQVDRVDVVALGRSTDLAALRLLYDFVKTEIERMCPKGQGRVFKRNFFEGAAAAVLARLKEMATQEPQWEPVEEDESPEAAVPAEVPPDTKTTALAIIDRQKQEMETHYAQYSAKQGLRKVRASGGNYDPRGYYAGREAGERIHLGERLPAGTAQRQLK